MRFDDMTQGRRLNKGEIVNVQWQVDDGSKR